MNKQVTDIKAEAEIVTGVALLRQPFPPHQISKLPKPLAKREDMDKLPKAKCAECGGYHATSKIIHLDYVGHAALTDRLLDADPEWTWEPAGYTAEGLPLFDKVGGLWIKLTVCGVTRMGYGSADGKTGGDAVKEIIGDALRNAAMRFGAALDLWHKGDLHAPEEADDATAGAEAMAINLLRGAGAKEWFKEAWDKNKDGWKAVLPADSYARVVAVMKECAAKFQAEAPKAAEPKPAPAGLPSDDEIPF